MAEEIRIDIKANDKASTVLKQVARNSQNLGSSTRGLAGLFGKLGGGLNDAVSSLTGFNLAGIATAATVGKLIDGIAKTISEYSGYVEQVDKVSQRTGMASEEISRLLQVADDFRVDMKTMENAMSMALQNGFNPTTENLAELADRLRGIQDPTQRAAELQKIFGRQWRDVVPLLNRGGDAIREAADGISDGLVVTQDAIDANREYQKAVDDLSDSWTAFKYAATKEVIPALNSLLQELMDSETVVRGTQLQVDGLGGTFITLAENEAQATQATINWGLRYAGMAEVAKTAVEETAIATDEAADDAEGALDRWAGMMNYSAQKAEEMRDRTYKVYDDLKTAHEDFNGAVKTFNEKYGDQVIQKLEDAGIKGEDYEAALAILDDELGTNYVAQKDANDQLDDAIEAFGKTRDIDAFREALNLNKDKWAELDEKVQNAKTALDNARDAFNLLISDISKAAGKTFNISVAFGGGGGTAITNTGTGGGRTTWGGESEGANGLDMVVPPGYPNDSYNIKVTSGEHVKVTPAGQTGTVNNYNLIINEAGTRGNILSDFNLLKALTRA